MRASLLIVGLSVLNLVACTRATREEPRVPVNATEREAEVKLEEPPPAEPLPAPRPRLSRTITLGEGTPDQYTPSHGPLPPTPAAPSTVVVNNNTNTVVVGGVGGYGYGYGYAPRGYGYGRPTTFYEGRPAFRAGSSPWGTTGWEGARRTAAPGQTPGVGGNWAPAPSYGPAMMK